MDFGNPAHETQLKRYITSLIVQEAQADGEFSIVEKKYLAFATKELGLSDAEVAAIRLNPNEYQMEAIASEQDRMTVLYYLLFMMRADQAIKKEEEAICHHVGFKLGFRRELISDLINIMRDCMDKDIPPNAMLERVRTYMN